MKLIHLSDLHIGKKVGPFSMLDEQRHVLDQIIKIVQNEAPDAVLIAGDVYDKASPITEAVTLCDDFLVRLSRVPSMQVFVSSGNHDSAERIAFANRLISEAGVHMSSVFGTTFDPITLTDEHGPVNVYMLPFVKPVHVRHAFPESNARTFTEAVSVAIDKMNVNQSERNVLMAHQTVTGSLHCDSELNIGGVDNTDLAPYLVFDYVALGHIHSPQSPREGQVRYCGSPLKYSFSECGQQKSVTIVEMGAKGQVNVRTEPLHPLHDFIRIKGAFDEIFEQYLNEPLEDFVEITLTDEVDVPDAFRRLQNIFPRLMSLRYDNTRTREKKQVSVVHDIVQRSATEVFESLFSEVQNTVFSDEQRAYVEGIVRQIEEDLQCGR